MTEPTLKGPLQRLKEIPQCDFPKRMVPGAPKRKALHDFKDAIFDAGQQLYRTMPQDEADPIIERMLEKWHKSTPHASDDHVRLNGSQRYQRAGAQTLGLADPHQRCEVTVKLRRQKALPQPEGGKAVLPRGHLPAEYGASPADLKLVEDRLSSFGLEIRAKSAERRTIVVAGSVAKMEQAFKTKLFRSKQGDEVYRSRTGYLHIPRELDGIVEAVLGLDSRRMVKRRATRSQARSLLSNQLPPPNQRPWFLPQELADHYNFPKGDGTGQTIGLIELGGQYIERDLRLFAELADLPAIPTVNVINVETLDPSDQNDPDAIGEVMLDIEVAAAVCPRATLAVYFSNFTEKGWVDVIDAALDDTTNSPGVLSISYGLAEGADIWTQQAMDAVNDALQEAALRGITICVAAGDDGSDDQVGDGRAHVNFPASSPYVLCVGGTTLLKPPQGTSETVWFEGDGLRRDGGGATGGGVSAAFDRPDWQQSFTDIKSVNPGGRIGRIVPDVAADAAGGTGYFAVALGRPGVVGGTSAATPLWAALIARLAAAGANVQYLTPLLYQPGGNPLGARACNDIKVGNNDSAPIGGYSAGTGFDPASGWGSPDGQKLLNGLPRSAAP